MNDPGAADPPLTPEQQQRVQALTEADLQRIDQELLSNCSRHWRKVARVVALTMPSFDHLRGIPDVFYAQRVRGLVDQGLLQFQGDPQRMRFSEVRLPADA